MHLIYSLELTFEQDVVQARKRCREVTAALGYENQDQVRITTAVSEITRNAFQYANGGKVRFLYAPAERERPARLVIEIEDRGKGIPQLEEILLGRYVSPTGMGMGILGARRLMESFEVVQRPGNGSLVRMEKILPAGGPVNSASDLRKVADRMLAAPPTNAFDEIRQQNQELVRALAALRARETELADLNGRLASANTALASTNQELEETNRGVVALYAELDEKTVALKKADELKTKFLSNMTHEFRTPLNSIIGLSRLLLDGVDGPLTPEQEKQARFIHRAADDLLVLVNDLLDLAKVEAGKTSVRIAAFRANDLFSTLKGLMRPLIPDHGRIALLFDDVSEFPELLSDEGKIAQVLRNLISNALKFTEAGEVRVSARMASPTTLELRVRDTGIGIAPEFQERIFSEYGQVDTEMQRHVKGTGLGLPLSKSLVELLGGRLEVESAPGAGSVFTALIPVQTVAAEVWEKSPRRLVLVSAKNPEALRILTEGAAAAGFDAKELDIEDPAAQIRLWEPQAILLEEGSAPLQPEARMVVPPIARISRSGEAGGPRDGARLSYSAAAVTEWLIALQDNPPRGRVLVVDDEETSRYLLRTMLRGYGMEILECRDGAKGLETAAREHPDVIFLDYSMPGMNGLEVLRALKRSQDTRDIPVVVHSSKLFTGDELAALNHDALAVIPKENSSREEQLKEIDWVINQTLRRSAGAKGNSEAKVKQ